MKKLFLCCVIILLSKDIYACTGSNCTACPDGFLYTTKCCKREYDRGYDNCVFQKDKEIENCGKGDWKDYPYFFSVQSLECCKDEQEDWCSYNADHLGCGTGKMKNFPYTPIKKCCKDEAGKDCVIIRSKRKCGEYQLSNYPSRDSDCCTADFTKCTGSVRRCPRCSKK